MIGVLFDHHHGRGGRRRSHRLLGPESEVGAEQHFPVEAAVYGLVADQIAGAEGRRRHQHASIEAQAHVIGDRNLGADPGVEDGIRIATPRIGLAVLIVPRAGERAHGAKAHQGEGADETRMDESPHDLSAVDQHQVACRVVARPRRGDGAFRFQSDPAVQVVGQAKTKDASGIRRYPGRVALIAAQSMVLFVKVQTTEDPDLEGVQGSRGGLSVRCGRRRHDRQAASQRRGQCDTRGVFHTGLHDLSL